MEVSGILSTDQKSVARKNKGTGGGNRQQLLPSQKEHWKDVIYYGG